MSGFDPFDAARKIIERAERNPQVKSVMVGVEGLVAICEELLGKVVDVGDDLDKQVEHLLTLEQGWDSYNANPPDESTVRKAEEFARLLEDEFSSPPTLVPCSDGSIQIEWHCDGWDVEMGITRFQA